MRFILFAVHHAFRAVLWNDFNFENLSEIHATTRQSNYLRISHYLQHSMSNLVLKHEEF